MYSAFKSLRIKSGLSQQWSKSEKQSRNDVFVDKQKSRKVPLIFWNVKMPKEMQQRWFHKL